MLRWLRRGVVGLGGLLLLAVAAVAGLLWLTLPERDAARAIPGLSAPASATLDQDGIPRVTAANETDAAAVLGWLHARERLFQMELMRRAASGELSELFGRATLPFDRMMRTLGLRHRALADLATLPPQARALLEAYARGVNAVIASRGRLAAPEFVAFGAPRAWEPVDSLLWGKTMGLYLSGNWRQERARLLLEATLPRELVDELWPDGGGAGHPEAALPPDPALARTAAKLAAAIPEFPAPFTLPASASNAWAVAGAHSLSGAPLLAGDPHLGFGFPSVWYLARIDTPGGVLAGATAPGVPFLVLGHNGHIAWSFTTTGADTQDLFIETSAGEGQYLTPDGPLPYTVREERIHVRGAPDEVLAVRQTRHGPVISDLVDRNGPVLALAASDLAPGDTAAAGLLALNRARSVAEAGAAAGLISNPVQNLMVADRDGIGLFVTGRVPIRKAGDGARPVPGADGAHDWTGWASGAALPRAVAPESGRLVNANERVAPPEFPVFLGRDWYDDYRARRIRALLGATDKHSPASFASIQGDIVDLPARDLLPLMTRIAPSDGPVRTGLGLLAGWDGAARGDAPQALLWNAWVMRFTDAVLAHIGVPEAGRPAVAPWPQLLRHVLSPQGAHLCGGDCAPLLSRSLSEAMAALSAAYGSDPARWRWSEAHVAVFAHPVLRMLPLLGPMLEGRIGLPGDGATVDRAGFAEDFVAVHGPEFRGVYDLANLDGSLFVLAPGQSGNPFSRHARDFLQRWRDIASVTLAPRPDHVTSSFSFSPAAEESAK